MEPDDNAPGWLRRLLGLTGDPAPQRKTLANQDLARLADELSHGMNRFDSRQYKGWDGWQNLRASDRVEYAPTYDPKKHSEEVNGLEDVIGRKKIDPAYVMRRPDNPGGPHGMNPLIEMMLRGETPIDPYGFGNHVFIPYTSGDTDIIAGFPSDKPNSDLGDWPVNLPKRSR